MSSKTRTCIASLSLLLALPLHGAAQAGGGSVERLDSFHPALFDTLDPGDSLGWGVSSLGDVDGDGLPELVLGAPLSCQRGRCDGALWIVTADPVEGLVAPHLVAPGHGGFDPGPLQTAFGLRLGEAVAALGDLDGNGAVDLALGAPRLGNELFVLFLEADGTVGSHAVVQGPGPGLGSSLQALGDLDGDGTLELAVGYGVSNAIGQVAILSLDAAANVVAQRTFGGDAGLGGVVPPSFEFGRALTRLGDLDGDGVDELVVGSTSAVSIVFLGTGFAQGGSTALGQVDLSQRQTGFLGPVALASPGDLDEDGNQDLALGRDIGVQLLFLNSDGSVRDRSFIAEGQGGFVGPLGPSSRFGIGLAAAGDLDGNGVGDLWVGDVGTRRSRGGVWSLFLDTSGTVIGERLYAEAQAFQGTLDDGDHFGDASAALGGAAGRGPTRLLVGASRTDEQGENTGSVRTFDVDARGELRAHGRISPNRGLTTSLAPFDRFGAALAPIDDWNGDRLPDVAVGVPGRDGLGPDEGALLLLALDRRGALVGELEIGGGRGGFAGALQAGGEFGSAVVQLDDLDGDGIGELAVGAPRTDTQAVDDGAVWILFRNADGTVRDQHQLELLGTFGGPPVPGTGFGASLALVGDLDGDGRRELAVGAPGAQNGQGVVWILFLDAAGNVRDEELLGAGFQPLPGLLPDDAFGSALVLAGDQDGDGLSELAVGAPSDSRDGTDQGALWLLGLGSGGEILTSRRIGHGALELQVGDLLGSSLGILASPGRRAPTLLVGAPGDAAGGAGHGALWTLAPRASRR